jgi:hypothetical protein
VLSIQAVGLASINALFCFDTDWTSEAELAAIIDVVDKAFSLRMSIVTLTGLSNPYGILCPEYFKFALGDVKFSRVLLKVHLMTALADDAGEIHVAETTEDGIIGVSVWFGPGGLWLST